ncbi:SAM-dependent methyltransferase [Amphritea japonica]|uniref:Cyclopropane-fatty-acyl-phospholipid synthase n=2 Tax=Amphritea TaxID=515417 RepID=A0A7R6PCZ2_9GAMM|nr:cyclopropane-fatty-acyl-phospholipid synthase family protein [Amphritea japonica]BBB26781.1 cyclopropane-fatty-acyl-phospholipid synthase [Amphritea japonica ATCC BAA-1530]
MPSGYHTSFGDQKGFEVTIKLNNLRCLFRLFTGGSTGWAEGYTAGEWDTQDLTSLLRWGLQNETMLENIAKAGHLKKLAHNIYHWRNQNSRTGSRRNIAAHYDLGNDFYALWLDKTMSYSAALFESDEQNLDAAQIAKYQQIIDMLGSKQDDHIVEIGCGWGGFAEQLLQQHNVRVHGVTLSEEQLQWSRDRLAAAGLDRRSNISLTDYRDLITRYDGVVSIEMFEAVGEKYWDTYFETLKSCLKPCGKAILQVISIEDQRFETYREQADFIQRYIFPGGMLPSISRLKQKFVEHGFELQQEKLFGQDYALTLKHWRASFEQQTEALEKLGYDERFRRLWRYYLCYCEAGFEEGSIDVGLYQLINRNP